MKIKPKVKTPEWILKGYDSPVEYERQKNKFSTLSKQSDDSSTKAKGKIFKIKVCPKCGSDDVKVIIGEVGIWECKKCGWKGKDIKEEELTEDEFMKYLDKKGEKVA
jgi:ribosomal protein L37AE/L43A